MRTSKNITDKNDIDFLINVKEEDCTFSFLMELFGEFNEKVRFNPYDTVIIPARSYGKTKKNKNAFHTTVGIWIWNKMFIEEDLSDFLGYINEEIDSKRWDKLMNDQVSRLALEDDVSIEVLDHLLMKAQKVMPMCSVLSESFSDKFLKCSTHCEGKKKELAKKYADGIKAGDPATASKMEKELINYAKDYLKDDPTLDLYNSGARSSFNNHFKNMYLMKGAIANPDPNAEKPFDIALSCYNNGISKDEYALFCNSLASGPYHRARKTAIGGYWEKLFIYGYQHIKIGPKGSDCGTKDTVEILLTENNIDGWMYSNIVTSNGLVELTSKNMNKFIGKKVKFRFSGLCEYSKDSSCICNACLGNLFYRQGTENIGIAVSTIASIIKNINMKAFHDSTVSLSKIDVKKAFGE